MNKLTPAEVLQEIDRIEREMAAEFYAQDAQREGDWVSFEHDSERGRAPIGRTTQEKQWIKT